MSALCQNTPSLALPRAKIVTPLRGGSVLPQAAPFVTTADLDYEQTQHRTVANLAESTNTVWEEATNVNIAPKGVIARLDRRVASTHQPVNTLPERQTFPVPLRRIQQMELST